MKLREVEAEGRGLEVAEVHRDGEREVPDGQQRSDANRDVTPEGVVLGVVGADGLEHRPDAVEEVDAESEHTQHVGDDDGPVLKASHHVVVGVAHLPRVALDAEKVSVAKNHPTEGQMQEVERHVEEQDGSRVVHRLRGVVGREVDVLHVPGTARFIVPLPERKRAPDVRAKADQQSESGAPKQQRHGSQPAGVLVVLLRACVDLHVAEQVPEGEAEQDHPRGGHQGFLADR